MPTKLIKTAEDHAAAIERLAKLMDIDPAPDSPEADELELLAHLIEKYETEHHDIGLPDPLTAIEFRMEQQGLKNRDLVPYLGSQSRVSEVLGGKRALTVQMIRNLHEGLAIPLEALVQEPKSPDAKNVARGGAPDFSERAFKQMCARGWLEGFEGSWKEAQGRADELLERFFCFGSAVAALNRQMPRVGAKEDAFALLAWRTRVLRVAQGKKLAAEFDPKAITPEFLRHLAGLSRHKEGPLLAVELLEGHGIVVVVEQHLDGTFLDGAALRLPGGGAPVIGLTLRHDRLDNFWFCLFHELGHVVKHIAKGKGECFLDNLDQEPTDKLESEADSFAFDTLIPKKDWEQFRAAGAFDPISVRREAKRLLIGGAILAGRLRRERNNFQMLTGLVGHRAVRKLFAVGQENSGPARSARASTRR